MKQIFDTEAVRLDLETWERGPLFKLFHGFSEPYHGVCLRVECTQTFAMRRSTGSPSFCRYCTGR